MIRTCPDCTTYTLEETCTCGATTQPAGPGKFTPDDDYVAHRVAYKQQEGTL